jgi:hypothetical protein
MKPAHSPFPFVRLVKVRSIVDAEDVCSQKDGANHSALEPGAFFEGWMINPPKIGSRVTVLEATQGLWRSSIFESAPVIALPSAGEFISEDAAYKFTEIAPRQFSPGDTVSA